MFFFLLIQLVNHYIYIVSEGLFSRWEFIQGESAMQRRYVNTNRSSASRSYRKKLQKRLWQHKQQLHELEQVKKAATFKVCIFFFIHIYEIYIGLYRYKNSIFTKKH
jgi:hypothetical protein